MSGGIRKCKSLWDRIGETKVPAEFSEHTASHEREVHSSNRANWSDLEGRNLLYSNDCSRLSSRETLQQNNDHRDLNKIPQNRRAPSGYKRYSISPEFNARRRQNRTRSPDNNWSHTQRYEQRSRSRSRSSGRGESRSKSRGIGRERDGDWDRENYGTQHEYYEWNDGKSDYRISSQLCRDFAAGKCRKGSQCRLLHQDNLNLGDGGQPESDRAERWRGRREGVKVLESVYEKRPRDHSLDKVSNYDRHNRSAPFDHDLRLRLNRNSNIPCKYFAVGRCQRNDCRFSHDGPASSSIEGRLRDNRHDHNLDDEGKYWNGPKWGGSDVGSMNEENGWNGPKWGDVNGAPNVNITKGGDSDVGSMNEEKCGNGPKWGDANGGSNVKVTGWGESDVGSMNEEKCWNGPKWGDVNGASNVKITGWGDSVGRSTAKEQIYERWDQNLDAESKSWNGPKSGDATGFSDANPTAQVDSNAGFSEPKIEERKTDEIHGSDVGYRWSTMENGNIVANTVTRELHGAPNSFGKEVLPITQVSHSQGHDGNSLQTSEQISEGTSSKKLPDSDIHPIVPENSYSQQHDSKKGDNNMITDDSNAPTAVSISRDTMHLMLPNQSSDHYSSNTLSLLPFGTEREIKRMATANPLKGHMIDLNGLGQRPSLNLQNESKNLYEESTEKQDIQEIEVPQVDSGISPNVVHGERIAQATNLSASLHVIFGDGKKLPELHAALNPKSSTELLTSLSSSANVARLAASVLGQRNPTMVSQKQYEPIHDSIHPIKYGNSDKPYVQDKPNPLVHLLQSSTEEPCKHGSNNKPFEEDKPMPVEHLLQSSAEQTGGNGNKSEPHELDKTKPSDYFLSSSSAKPDSCKQQKVRGTEKECQESSILKQQESIPNLDAQPNCSVMDKISKPQQKIQPDKVNAEGVVQEVNCSKDEKDMRLFKVALVEYVKEILKPTWKEGQMSREVHKAIVKKVVEKVTSTIQGVHVPKTNEKIDQYLSYSKPKLTKLVQAYTERLLKNKGNA